MIEDSSILSDSALVRGLLWEFFPERRGDITRLEEEEGEFSALGVPATEVGAYSLISEIFIDKTVSPFLSGRSVFDPGLAKRCADFLENLLAFGRPSIEEMVNIRVTDYLLGYPENWVRFRKYAGSLLTLEVKGRSRYYEDPFGIFESPDG
jgi:hypothetical protein